LGATAGSLNADQTTGSVSLQLLEGYGRAELALVPRGTVSPVLSLGAGAYRLKSGDNGQTVDHTNLFWSGGVGADVVVTASVIVELRVERQWMRDARSEEHTSELQSRVDLVCRLLLEKKKTNKIAQTRRHTR